MKAKKLIFPVLALLLFSFSGMAQKKESIEVLYFKANLSCCKAKACNAIEGDIKAMVEKNYPEGNVVFREVKLDDAANKELVEKYKAESMTVIVVRKKKKKEYSENITADVKNYMQTQNKEAFEKELLAKVSGLQKK